MAKLSLALFLKGDCSNICAIKSFGLEESEGD